MIELEKRVTQSSAYEDIEKSVIEDLGLEVLKTWDNLSLTEQSEYLLNTTEIINSVLWVLRKKGIIGPIGPREG